MTGTGPGGRVLKGDVLAATAVASPGRQPGGNGTTPGARPEPATRPPAGRTTREPMSPIRKRIAQRLLESQNQTATLTTFNEADLSVITELRAKYNERFEKRHGVKLGFMSVFVKAVVEALKAYPLVNARIDGADVVHQHFYDIGVAVSTEKGLMVPVLRDADRLEELRRHREEAIGERGEEAPATARWACRRCRAARSPSPTAGIFGSYAQHADPQPAAERPSWVCTAIIKSGRWW